MLGASLVYGMVNYVVGGVKIPIAFFNGAFDPANFAVSANFPFTSLFLTSPTPTTLVLNYTPVPEPTGILFAVVAAAWTTRRIGRRKAPRTEQC